ARASTSSSRAPEPGNTPDGTLCAGPAMAPAETSDSSHGAVFVLPSPASPRASVARMKSLSECLADPAQPGEVMHIFWQGRYLDDGNGRVRRHERPGHPPLPLTQVH